MPSSGAPFPPKARPSPGFSKPIINADATSGRKSRFELFDFLATAVIGVEVGIGRPDNFLFRGGTFYFNYLCLGKSATCVVTILRGTVRSSKKDWKPSITV